MNVQEVYLENLKKGMTQKDAAKMAQAKTGVSVVSGRPITKKVSFTKGATAYGQYRYAK
jgi:hypothetical protein